MYVFGVIVLLGLATLVGARVVDRFLTVAQEFWAAAFVALGVGAAWLADFDLFTGWGFAVRNHATGVTLTGLAVAGAAYFWREILAFFGGLTRKFNDEAVTLEKTQGLRRVA